MTQTPATAPVVTDSCFIARVYADHGQWFFCINRGNEPFAFGCGYATGEAAEDDMRKVLPRPYSLYMEHQPDAGLIYGPVLQGGAA